MAAARSSHARPTDHALEMLEQLLACGVDIMQNSSVGTILCSPLPRYADYDRPFEYVQRVLDLGVDINWYDEERDCTAVALCAVHDKLEMMTFLHQRGADLRRTRRSLLYTCVIHDAVRCALYCLHQGLELELTDTTSGRTILELALSSVTTSPCSKRWPSGRTFL